MRRREYDGVSRKHAGLVSTEPVAEYGRHIHERITRIDADGNVIDLQRKRVDMSV